MSDSPARLFREYKVGSCRPFARSLLQTTMQESIESKIPDYNPEVQMLSWKENLFPLYEVIYLTKCYKMSIKNTQSSSNTHVKSAFSKYWMIVINIPLSLSLSLDILQSPFCLVRYKTLQFRVNQGRYMRAHNWVSNGRRDISSSYHYMFNVHSGTWILFHFVLSYGHSSSCFMFNVQCLFCSKANRWPQFKSSKIYIQII